MLKQLSLLEYTTITTHHSTVIKRKHSGPGDTVVAPLGHTHLRAIEYLLLSDSLFLTRKLASLQDCSWNSASWRVTQPWYQLGHRGGVGVRTTTHLLLINTRTSSHTSPKGTSAALKRDISIKTTCSSSYLTIKSASVWVPKFWRWWESGSPQDLGTILNKVTISEFLFK